jgi:DNA gyrase subunit A
MSDSLDKVYRSNVLGVSIVDEMRSSYLEYAMSVIISRAVPDARDGLKCVHRRVIYGMYDLGAHYNKNYKKSARIVGEVIGKYHPHGEAAVYDSLVRMAQTFSLRICLIDGQGNFGSVDGDPPAAARYTEARLSKISHTFLNDIDKETVDFRPNYDGNETEPSVLPASFPNILVNGSEGIAVGMATSVPTHNLTEIISACQFSLQNPLATDDEIVSFVSGPDLPTGGIIISKNSIKQAMLTGRGSIVIRGRVEIEELSNKKTAIIIKEIPFQVNKAKLIEKIADLIKDKIIDDISNIRDESNKEGIRVVLELKRDANTDIVLNNLYKNTSLQTSVSYNMLLLNNGKPELMNIPSVIRAFLRFREEVVVKRSTFSLNQNRNKAHIASGLFVAVEYIDEVISIIRSSQDVSEARERLMERPWIANDDVCTVLSLVSDKRNKVIDGKFYYTKEQADAILNIRLSKLTALEKNTIIKELGELSVNIKYYLEILTNRDRLIAIIYDELEKIKTEFGTPRLTEINEEITDDIDIESLIPQEDVLITITAKGYIKRTLLSSYNSQRRGGKGRSGMNTKEDDYIKDIFKSDTHASILFFTKNGKVLKLRTYDIPESNINTSGRAVINLIQIEKGDSIASYVVLPKEIVKNIDNEDDLSFSSIIFATKAGLIRKSSLKDFIFVPKNGKRAIELDESDELIGVQLARNTDDIFLATKDCMAIRFSVGDLRTIKSRTSDGVIGIKLNEKDCVISLSILFRNESNIESRDKFLKIPVKIRKAIKICGEISLDDRQAINKVYEGTEPLSDDVIISFSKQEQFILTIKNNGYGKVSSSFEYKQTNRGGKGITNILNSSTKDFVVGVVLVGDDSDIMIIDDNGKIIRCSADDLTVTGRMTKGPRIIRLDKDRNVVSIVEVQKQFNQDEDVKEL